MRKSKRTLAFLMVLLLLCSTLLGFCGAFLLMRYPGHACCGQHCLFCGVLNAVDVLLHHGPFAVTAAALIAVLLAAVIGRAAARVRNCHTVLRTPITLKTKILA